MTAEAAVTFTDKTLVAWVAPANLDQRGGAALSVGGLSQSFDAIVLGEIEPRRWMAGSHFFLRTCQEQAAWPEEAAEPGRFVQIAIAYRGREVTILRNGETYAQYTTTSDPVAFNTDSLVLLGLRHLGAGNGYFAGIIEDARVYDTALDSETIRALEPNRLTGPRPLGWWSFKGGSPDDQMGAFAPGQLLGGARIEGGRLHLDGVSGCLMSRKAPAAVRTEQGWPRYHLTVLPDEGIACPYDANGCLYWKGRYHLMYIFQRADGGHCWGHASSPDLIRWTFHPAALEPHPGEPDAGIFSGNAFLNRDGVPMLCWFGIDAGVCVATAADDDLIRWEKHPSNPIIPIPKPGEPGHGVYGVFDPFLWLEGDTYVCLLAGNRHPGINRDTLYYCTSRDLVHWEARHAFFEGDPSWRREDEDCSCPDFFRVGDRHVLMCISHPIGARFYEGSFDPVAGRFEPRQHVRMNWPGGMFFAPESLEAPDGRRLFWAWVTDPRVRPAQEATGSGFQSLPRVLDFEANGTPRITPAEELAKLRKRPRQVDHMPLAAGEEKTLAGFEGAHVELAVEIDPGQAQAVGVKVRCSPDGGEETAVWYERAAGALRLDMSRSTLREDVTYGSPPFTSYGLQRAADNPHFYGSFEAPLTLAAGENLRLRVFIDGPMLEVFANDRQCLTQVLFPQRDDSLQVRVCTVGGPARLVSARAWEMGTLKIVDRRQG
jgi:sucrose-6-phosphate hydrolase SacC (GH32 family)